MPTKKCSICGEVKEIEKFTIAKGKVQDYCKACRETYKEMHKRKMRKK